MVMTGRASRALMATLAELALLGGTAACKQKTPEEQMMASLSDQPELKDAFVTLKRTFPDQYNAIIQTAVQQQKSGTNAKDAYAAGFGQMQQFMRSQIPNMVQAPDDLQIRYLGTQRDLLKAAQANSIDWCGKIAQGRVNPSEQPPKALIGPAARVTQAGFELARAGQDKPAGRAAFTPGPADAQSLIATMQSQGASPALVQKILSPGGLLSAAPAEACDGAIRLYSAVAAMPPAQAAKWSALFLRSAG